jgi:hypothetical protein
VDVESEKIIREEEVERKKRKIRRRKCRKRENMKGDIRRKEKTQEV